MSNPRGVYVLLDYLESIVARPTLPEASRFVMKFFYGMQRRKGETMTSWITRHAEGLWEASQSLRRVQREFGGTAGKTMWLSGGDQGRRHRTSEVSSHGSGMDHPFREDGTIEEDEDEAEQGWSDRGWRAWSEWSESTWHSKEYEPPASWDTSTDIFIPEFLAGFLLLNRSGLDANERGNVLATIRGEFSTSSVARALREQWSDDDLQKRDRQRASAALYAEEEDEDPQALVADENDWDLGPMSGEQHAAYMAEQEVVNSALAAIRSQKATLKEARWKQKQIKLGGGFYPPKPYSKGSSEASGSQKGSGRGRCFRCNGPHLVAECPHPPQQAKVAHEEAAEIAFTAGVVEVEESGFLGECISGEAVLDRCMAVVDSGATASLASAEALEKVMQSNINKYGDPKMEIDVTRRPTFRFGNGARKDCMSTVQLGLGAGDLQGKFEVHVHDSPNQPILLSRKALKALGAIIDFRNGDVIYTSVDSSKVCRLPEASNGHLLMPMTGDILEGACSRRAEFVSLRE